MAALSNRQLRNNRLLLGVQEEAVKATEPEDLAWLIFRYSNLLALPHDERSMQGLGSAGCQVVTSTLPGVHCWAFGSVGKTNRDELRVHVNRSSVYFPEQNAGQGLYMLGPLKDLLDTPLNRSKLYINLLAKFYGIRQRDLPQLTLWLPGSYKLAEQINSFRDNAPYKVSAKQERLWGQLLALPHRLSGAAVYKVDYNEERIDKLLDFHRKNPTFNADKPGWLQRLVSYTEDGENQVYSQRATRQPRIEIPTFQQATAGQGAVSTTATQVGATKVRPNLGF
jgi:hypothetical protein